MEFIKGVVRTAFEKSPTRILGYGSAIATAIALWVAAQLKLSIPPELLLTIGGLGAAAVIEAIRKFVYSKNTVQNLADQIAGTPPGTIDIGNPPDASPVLPPPSESGG